MSHDEPLSPQLSGLAAALANLTPAAPRLDRDRLMYLAGQAAAEADSPAVLPTSAPLAAEAPRWLWPTVAAVFALLSLTLGALHFRPSEPPLVQTEPSNPRAETAPPTMPTVPNAAPTVVDANSYLRLRQVLLVRDAAGFAPLDAVNSGDAPRSNDPADYQRLRQELMGG